MLSELGNSLTKSLDMKTKKNNGIYFTPKNIVNKCYGLLTKYIDNEKQITILEPSCGSLEFITNNNINKFNINRLDCYELNTEIYNNITSKEIFNKLNKITKNINIYNQDYLKSSLQDKYDLIIGNPPYFVTKNKLYNEYYTGRPNIYIQFIIHSLHKLNDNGILCFVIPLTLLNSEYYKLTRDFIINDFKILEIFINKDKFKETSYNTFILIVQNINKDNENNAKNNTENDTKNEEQQINNLNKSFVFKGILTPYKQIFKQMLKNEHYYLNNVCTVANGWFIWNEHKEELTNKNNKNHNRCTLYYANENRTNYIKHYKGNIIKNDVIVIYRGNGNNSFKWKPRIIKYEGSGIVLENHLLYLNILDGFDINEIFANICNEKTKTFAEMFITSGSLTTKILLNKLPIFTN